MRCAIFQAALLSDILQCEQVTRIERRAITGTSLIENLAHTCDAMAIVQVFDTTSTDARSTQDGESPGST